MGFADTQITPNVIHLYPAFVGLFYLSANHIKFTYLIKHLENSRRLGVVCTHTSIFAEESTGCMLIIKHAHSL